MANKGKVTYIARFVILCWIAIGAVIGAVIGVAHILKNTTATIIVIQLVLYSCLFGFMASQFFKLKRKDERHDWRSSGEEWPIEEESEEPDGGWK